MFFKGLHEEAPRRGFKFLRNYCGGGVTEKANEIELETDPVYFIHIPLLSLKKALGNMEKGCGV